jgi:hypothetical protein
VRYTNQAGLNGYQLRCIMARGDIASVFLDENNPDNFMAGYVRAVNERQVLLESLTPWGRFDGFLAIRLDAILGILSGDEYEERLERLVELNGQSGQPFQAEWSGDLMQALLNAARDSGQVVTIWDETDAISALVERADELHVQLRPLSYMGVSMEPSVLRMKDVILVSLGSEEEKMYQMLHDSAEKCAGPRGLV